MKIRKTTFSLLPVLMLLIILGISFFKNKSTDLDSAKQLLNDIKRVRIAIDQYYLKTGEFPDLLIDGAKDNLELIAFRKNSDEFITFSSILGENIFPATPEYKDLESTNIIYDTDSFKEFTNDGGWYYNKVTGEIHVNVPYNLFDQGIEWNTY